MTLELDQSWDNRRTADPRRLPVGGTGFSVLQELWSEDSTIDALGIAGTMASGILAVQYGAMVCSPM